MFIIDPPATAGGTDLLQVQLILTSKNFIVPGYKNSLGAQVCRKERQFQRSECVLPSETR